MRYNATNLRKEKTAITQQIVEIIQSSGDPPGRFLGFDHAADGWVKVGDAVARRKVSHAIRYDSRYKKRKATQESFEASVQEASTHRSDPLRQGTPRSGNHRERSGDRNPLVSDGDILAGLGYFFHSSNDDDDAPVPWNLSLALGEYIQALEARATPQHCVLAPNLVERRESGGGWHDVMVMSSLSFVSSLLESWVGNVDGCEK
jgi:hypothetical protein